MAYSIVVKLLIYAVIIASVVAIVSIDEYKSSSWVIDESSEVNSDHSFRFIVALALTNTRAMHNHLMDISDPKSINYGNYLTRDEIKRMYGPSEEKALAVTAFFNQFGEASLSPSGDMLQVTAKVKDVESALGTSLAWYTNVHQHTERRSLRAVKPLVIPKDLKSHISFISLNAPVNHAYPRGNVHLNRAESQGNFES
jgi:tripeptidyl-peptidase-1